MDFSIGQLIKLDGNFYIVDGLTESGRPNKVYNADKYGKITSDRVLFNNSKNGWDVSWEEATPLDPKYAKYEKVIAKMHQLDRKFKNRNQTKKDLTASNLADIMTRLTESIQRTDSSVVWSTIQSSTSWSTVPTVLTATDYDF